MVLIYLTAVAVLYSLYTMYAKSGEKSSWKTETLRLSGIYLLNPVIIAVFITWGPENLIVFGGISVAVALITLSLFRALLSPPGAFWEKEIPSPTVRRMPAGRKDFFIAGGICLVYGCVGLWNLGLMEAPVTEAPLASGEALILDFGEEPYGGTFCWYLKDSGYNTVTAEFRNSETEPWGDRQEISMDRVFCWGNAVLDSSGRYLRLTNTGRDMTIGELVFLDEGGRQIRPENTAQWEPLFDEADVFPEVIDYRSGTYFDESYYSRTVYEFLNGQPAFEVTHPPLGKILISLGAVCFGTTPFGFRIVGAVFGILMLPFLYLLGRDLTGSRLLGGLAEFLFAFDFMHYTQTRIATIDVYITFFTILMFFFMYRYSRMSFYDTPLWRTFVPLGACGISFGLGIASKWTGFYAGAGLAVIFFGVLCRRYREYLYAVQKPQGSSNGISHKYVLGHFWSYTGKTILFCMVFFVAVPFLIYVLSYVPFSDGTDAGLLERMWNNQKYMLGFHTGLRTDHPYASSWYQWPLMIRPVFYYSRIIDDTMRQGISAFGNPMVWWAGIPASVYMLYLWMKRRDKNAAFLCIAYAFCYLPWCLVKRCTFAYHYFPSVPVVVCMVIYSFAQWRKHMSARKFAILVTGYGALALGMFVLFYPVLSGKPVSGEYVAKVLRWLDTWALVQ